MPFKMAYNIHVIKKHTKSQKQREKQKMKFYIENRSNETVITDKMYIDFIKNTIEIEGWKVADTANKLALEMKKIALEQYRTAANLIVEAFLETL
jgi:ribosome-binding protein aMBF1 (putative translation factor)